MDSEVFSITDNLDQEDTLKYDNAITLQEN